MDVTLIAAAVTILHKLADVCQQWGESARDGCNADLQRYLASGAQNPCESSFRTATWKLVDDAQQALWPLSHRMAKTLEGDYLVVVNNLRNLAKPTGDSDRDFALWGPIFFANMCRDFARVLDSQKANKLPDSAGQGHRQPLPEGAALIFEKLRSLEPHQAMTLPAIQGWYEKKTQKNLDEGVWKRWRPELEAHGMKNRPNVGYYVPREEE